MLGIIESNAFGCYKVFAHYGAKMGHVDFKESLAWEFLQCCERLRNASYETSPIRSIYPRSSNRHEYVAMKARENNDTLLRRVCKSCPKASRKKRKELAIAQL
jgi:hypothetical protein